jgi:hypothetical protein
MSFGRSGTLVIAVFAGLAVLLAAGVLLRTPLQEVPIQIYPGYFYNDAGGYEKTIFYAGQNCTPVYSVGYSWQEFLLVSPTQSGLALPRASEGACGFKRRSGANL